MKHTEIKPSDILVVLDGKWTLAKIIKEISNSPAHHTGILFPMEDGTILVSEMEKEGHILTDFASEKYNNGKPKDRTLLVMRYKKDIDYTSMQQFCFSNTGKYDFFALLQHVIYRYTHLWLGRRNAKAAKRMTCSEWVAYAFHNYTGLFARWWRMKPSDIMQLHLTEFELYTF